MRPLIIGILVFIAWLIFSLWYYPSYLYPAFNPAEDAVIQETVDETPEPPPETPVIPDKPRQETLYFGYNSTVILDASNLGPFITATNEYLEAVPDACIRITGHTCDIGTSAYNADLGKRRALAVKEYLENNGISNECLNIASDGEEAPAVENTSENNRKLNRRAVVQINP